MIRATAFLWILLAVFLLARTEAQGSRGDEIAAVCPDEFPADAAERREIFRDMHAHRFAYSGECLSRAVDALLPAFEDTASPTNEEFELTAFALVRQTLIGAQCGVWRSRGVDTGSLWGARDALHLRQAENRTHIKTAIQSALRDPQTYNVQAPTTCVGSSVGRSYQDVTSSMLTPLIFSLDDERSIGVYTSWSDLPLLGYDVGLEEEYSWVSEYSSVSRRIRLRRTFLLRREGVVERLSEDVDRSDPGLVNIYQAGPSHIGLIVDGVARLIDPAHGQWRPLERSNPDTWVYLGAFGFLQWRTSLGNLDGETGFIGTHMQLECIPVIEGEVLYRLTARRERCDHPVYPSLEGPTTFGLTRLLADHLLELEPVLPGIAVVRAPYLRGERA